MSSFVFVQNSRVKKKVIAALVGYSFLTPALVILGFFTIFSIGYLFNLSFCKYLFLKRTTEYVGLRNYYYVFFRDPVFWPAMKNTFIYVGEVVLFSTLLGLLAAVLIQQVTRYLQPVLKVVFYIPVVTNAVAGALIWLSLYAPEFGLINYILGHVFNLSTPAWVQDAKWALPAIIVVGIWKEQGFNMVLFLAGLTAVPEIFYEAAEIDGAGRFQKFWYITLPLLRPILFFVVVTGIIRAFQVFALVDVMTRGGPGYSTTVIVYRLYQVSFQFLKIGRGAALSVFLFALILVVTLVQFKVIRSSRT